MYPTLWESPGGVGLHTYGLMMTLAFVAAFGLVFRLSRRVGFAPEQLMPVFGAAAVGGLFGARLLYALAVEPMETFNNPASLLAFRGLAFYGGVLGGTAGVLAVGRAQGLRLWDLVDVLAPALVLGLGIGRLGCFFAGCCHGAPILGDPGAALLPDGLLHGQIHLRGAFPYFSLVFDDGVGRLLHQALYPTQLWSVFAAIGVAGLLTGLWRKRRFAGQIFGTMLVIEPVFRVAIESFRADERGAWFTVPVGPELAGWLPGLGSAGDRLAAPEIAVTTSQGIGFAMMATGLLVLWLRRGAGVEAPAGGAGQSEEEEDLTGF
jgi:phosphatidylglycerol:prolipoprotein diacylglycerol transferase